MDDLLKLLAAHLAQAAPLVELDPVKDKDKVRKIVLVAPLARTLIAWARERLDEFEEQLRVAPEDAPLIADRLARMASVLAVGAPGQQALPGLAGHRVWQMVRDGRAYMRKHPARGKNRQAVAVQWLLYEGIAAIEAEGGWTFGSRNETLAVALLPDSALGSAVVEAMLVPYGNKAAVLPAGVGTPQAIGTPRGAREIVDEALKRAGLSSRRVKRGTPKRGKPKPKPTPKPTPKPKKSP